MRKLMFALTMLLAVTFASPSRAAEGGCWGCDDYGQLRCNEGDGYIASYNQMRCSSNEWPNVGDWCVTFPVIHNCLVNGVWQTKVANEICYFSATCGIQPPFPFDGSGPSLDLLRVYMPSEFVTDAGLDLWSDVRNDDGSYNSEKVAALTREEKLRRLMALHNAMTALGFRSATYPEWAQVERLKLGR